MLMSDGFICGIALGVLTGVVLMRTCPVVQDAVKQGEKMLEQGKKEIKKQVAKL